MKNHTEPTAIKPLLFIGLDVHKESIAVAIAEEGRNAKGTLVPAFRLPCPKNATFEGESRSLTGPQGLPA